LLGWVLILLRILIVLLVLLRRIALAIGSLLWWRSLTIARLWCPVWTLLWRGAIVVLLATLTPVPASVIILIRHVDVDMIDGDARSDEFDDDGIVL
jgi:hypothetical protein